MNDNELEESLEELMHKHRPEDDIEALLDEIGYNLMILSEHGVQAKLDKYADKDCDRLRIYILKKDGIVFIETPVNEKKYAVTNKNSG